MERVDSKVTLGDNYLPYTQCNFTTPQYIVDDPDSYKDRNFETKIKVFIRHHIL